MKMIRTIDPLLFLRDNITKNKKIYREGNYLIFEEGIRLKIDTPTALIKNQTNAQYSLGEIWFFLKHRSDEYKIYVKESQKEAIDMLFAVDKNKILDFFFNNVDNIELIDNNIRPNTLICLGKKRKGDAFLEAISSDLIKSKHPKTSSDIISQNLSLIKSDKTETKRANHIKNLEQMDPKLAIVDYIYSKEKKSFNRNSLLKPLNNPYNFENIFSFCKEVFTQNSNLKQHSERVSFLEELLSSDDLSLKAIIIVPSNFIEGNLCLENAKPFLEDSNYINLKSCSQEERRKCEENAKINVFKKKILDKEMSFEICDNVRAFTKNEWKRVVCVFVQGDDWEFKDWPKGENVTTILQKIKGFHLKYQDLPINENVKKWNVKILEISRNKRHFDVSIQNEFWNILSDFLGQQRKR